MKGITTTKNNKLLSIETIKPLGILLTNIKTSKCRRIVHKYNIPTYLFCINSQRKSLQAKRSDTSCTIV